MPNARNDPGASLGFEHRLWQAADKLYGQRVGTRWRFHREAVDEWLKSHPENSRRKAASDG